ncbi:MAG: hypothetical protein OHK0039_38760 [Bacteroidia bacterium]
MGITFTRTYFKVLWQLLLCWVCGFAGGVYAQSWAPTYLDQYHAQRYAADAAYRQLVDASEARLLTRTLRGGESATRGDVLTIPVVVHIMHLPEDSIPAFGTSNPSDDQILAGLNWLNEALANRGAFAGGPYYSDAGIPDVDMEVQLCLAVQDPDGNPTSGIVRVSTDLSNLKRESVCPGSTNNQDHCLRSSSYWDAQRYMNIWLVNDICDRENGNCDIMGYSLMAAAHGQLYDGPVLRSGMWGITPDDQAVLMRFIGHYFNLFDTWFQPSGPNSACINNNCLLDGDRVCDTPPDAGPWGGDCGDPNEAYINSCQTDMQDTSALNPFRLRDVQDLYENFMDGGVAACKNSFTPRQKFRVRESLYADRSGLLASQGCTPVVLNARLDGVLTPHALLCDARMAPELRIRNAGNRIIHALKLRYRFDGQGEAFFTWNGTLAGGDSMRITLPHVTLTPGSHIFRAELVEVNEKAGDDIAQDNKIRRTFFFFPPLAEAVGFPYCANFEVGSAMSDWRIEDPDQVLGFDVANFARCPEHGNQVLRYNTGGLWDGGSGPVASADGTHDFLISPVLDLRTYSNATLRFDVAFLAALAGHNLTLRVSVGRDCQRGLVKVYERSRQDLATVTDANGTIQPGWEPACEDWRTESLDLGAFAGQRIFLVFEVELESGYSQNLFLDNICLEADGLCVLPGIIPQAPGHYVADKYCTDARGWTHYVKSADIAPQTSEDALLFSIRNADAAGVLLEPGEVSMHIAPQYGQGAYDLTHTAPYAANTRGWYAAGRFVYLSPQAQPDTSVTVRFYFDHTDIEDLNASLPMLMDSMSQAVVFAIAPGINPDPASGHTHVDAAWLREIRPGAVASTATWADTTYDRYYCATFALDELGGIGLGSGGEGMGMGATYPMPIQIQGEQVFSRNELQWVSKREWRSAHYEVMRAVQGDSLFASVGVWPAAGFSDSPQVYTIADSAPQPGVNRYYVVMHHQNGVEVVSDTIAVRFDPARSVGVYPNPAPSLLRVRLELKEPTETFFAIFNGHKQKLIVAQWLQQADEAHEVNIESLAPGIYFYEVSYGGVTYHGKLIKSTW